jgi:hypothetical protein
MKGIIATAAPRGLAWFAFRCGRSSGGRRGGVSTSPVKAFALLSTPTRQRTFFSLGGTTNEYHAHFDLGTENSLASPRSRWRS